MVPAEDDEDDNDDDDVPLPIENAVPFLAVVVDVNKSLCKKLDKVVDMFDAVERRNGWRVEFMIRLKVTSFGGELGVVVVVVGAAPLVSAIRYDDDDDVNGDDVDDIKMFAAAAVIDAVVR